MKKLNSVLLSLLLAFSMTSSALAQVVNLDNKLIINNIEGGTASKAGKDINITATAQTVLTEWGLFNLAEGYSVNFLGDATFLNKVLNGKATFAGTINALGPNANVYFNCLKGALINPTANFNIANSLMLSTLNLKETDIAKLRESIEVHKKLELVVDNPNSAIRYGILIEDGVTVTLANRIDLTSSMIIDNSDSATSSPVNPVYSTTDGITFNLDNKGSVTSIASQTPVPGEKVVVIESKLYRTLSPPAPPTPVVDASVSSPDPLLPLRRLENQKVIAPTDLNNDLTGMPHNLAGTQTEVAPLEGTKVVNNLDDPNQFSANSVGTIAMNDSGNHMIAVSEFTPVGAASQVGNTGVNPDNEKYDFIISTPIVE